MTTYVLDIETNNLLANMLSYKALPYKLKEDAKLWCVVIRNVDTNEVKHVSLQQCTKAWLKGALADCTTLVTHNGIKFDLLSLFLFGVLDYDVGYPADNTRPATPHTLFGKPVNMIDTLLWSRMFNPDRYGGHSLKAWGERLGEYKGDYNNFSEYSDEMLQYCIQDTLVTAKVYKTLLKDWQEHDWSKSYSMEVKLADLAIKRETFGFDFDKELALECLQELEGIMQGLADKVNPLLPTKPLNKGQQQYFTPPKIQFKKNGEPSAAILSFAEKIGASVDNNTLVYKDKVFTLPYNEPVETHTIATIDDMDLIKQYLMDLGWTPSEWKERDLTKDAKKQNLTLDKRIAALDRWWEETTSGKFTAQRFEALGMPMSDKTYQKLRDKLSDKFPVRVPTSPCVRVGVEKNLCPNLVKLGAKVAFAQDFAHYLTYKHRRNSIAGGLSEDFDLDEDTPPTGYLSMIREDGRVSTPAIEIGASTSRYKHIGVCNVPRASSLYGEKMRRLFKCGDKGWQLGYDFSSLEAYIQGHHILPYEGEELAKSLLAKKPNDLHSVNAAKLGISRDDAKSINYALLYGAAAAKLKKMLGISDVEAKIMYENYWNAVLPLKTLKEKVTAYWESTGKKNILSLDERKLFARSQHSLLNLLFQGNGVICAKWTTVLLMRNLEEKGYRINPFLSDVDVLNMIDYHDEQALFVRKPLIKFNTFDSEEEAIAAKTNCANSSDIGHGKKYYFVENNAITQCIYDAVACAGETLNLRVKLGIAWSVGRNWYETH